MVDLNEGQLSRLLDNTKIAIVVPSYNEEKDITRVIKNILKHCTFAKIIIINDGSSDNTLIKVKNFIRNKNVIILSHIHNLGGGAAVQTGVLYAYNNGFNYVVQIDADGQHDPSEINKLLYPLIINKCDLVIGSRFLQPNNYQTSFIRYFGIKFYSRLASNIIHQELTDVTSGFKAMNRKIMEIIINSYSNRHPAFEFTIKVGKKGFKIKEVFVHMDIRRHGESEFSIIRFILFPIRMFISIIKVM